MNSDDLIKDACSLSIKKSQPFSKSLVQIIIQDILTLLEEGDKTQTTASGAASSIRNRYSKFL